jgi:hypothetical protein
MAFQELPWWMPFPTGNPNDPKNWHDYLWLYLVKSQTVKPTRCQAYQKYNERNEWECI